MRRATARLSRCTSQRRGEETSSPCQVATGGFSSPPSYWREVAATRLRDKAGSERSRDIRKGAGWGTACRWPAKKGVEQPATLRPGTQRLDDPTWSFEGRQTTVG